MKEKITGILLAGGQSKRMGMEKGSLLKDGRAIYTYPLSVLEDICDEILISSCNSELFDNIHEVVCDEIPGIGPMGGIYTCLKKSKSDLNLILAYDIPNVQSALLMDMLPSTQDYELVLPAMKEDRPEPLCAFYRKSVLNVVEKQIKQQNYAINKIFSQLNTHIYLLNSEMEYFSSNLFMNINSKEDLKDL